MCDHEFEKRKTFEGDPAVINGTNEIVYFVCRKCGEETFEPDGCDVIETDADYLREDRMELSA